MNIVIVGAGNIGLHTAKVLSREENNVILIDKDSKKLELALRDMDIATHVGDATDWQILEDLTELRPELFLALTDDDEVNLTACAIAKNLGYLRTICAVSQVRYLNCSRIDFGRIFYVDHFISPDILTAEEIYKCIVAPASIMTESFAHGAVQMRTFVVPEKWRKNNRKLCEMNFPKGMMIGLISRRGKSKPKKSDGESEKKRFCIFPHGDDRILSGDEVTVIGERDVIVESHLLFGISQKQIKSVVVVGGSKIGFQLAKQLERREINIRLIDKNYEKCCQLADKLGSSTVLYHDATDFAFLQSEKVGRADVFIACTSNDEINLLVSLLAKESGAGHVITVISDTHYIPVLTNFGIMHAISPRISAVNRILSIIQRDKVASMVSLYENKAEIMEIKVSMDSKIAGIPIMELGPQLPKDFLIAIIQNRGRIMVANGNRILSPGDTVIAITNSRHLKALRQLF